MTDIEKVIETIKGLCLCGNCTTPSIKGFERCADCDRYKAKKLTIQVLQEKADYDCINEDMKEKYGANVTIQDFYRIMMSEMRNQNKGEISAFMILTNKDKADYEKWKQEKADREKNLPLTLEELQEMDGQPCYLIDMEPPEYGWKNGWYLVDVETETVYNQYKCYFFKNIIGVAYRFKKEDESNEL